MIQIDLSDQGTLMASKLVGSEEFARIDERAKLLSRHLNLGAKRLMEFVYEHFPELTSLEFNESIRLEAEEC